MAEASERKRQSILRVEREWILRGCQARSTKSKERIQRYEELKDRKAPERDSAVQLSAASSRLGKKIITLEHVSKGYDGRTIFRDFPTAFSAATASASSAATARANRRFCAFWRANSCRTAA